MVEKVQCWVAARLYSPGLSPVGSYCLQNTREIAPMTILPYCLEKTYSNTQDRRIGAVSQCGSIGGSFGPYFQSYFQYRKDVATAPGRKNDAAPYLKMNMTRLRLVLWQRNKYKINLKL
jgi:hypothetical protein